jgi:hypothetical protein
MVYKVKMNKTIKKFGLAMLTMILVGLVAVNGCDNDSRTVDTVSPTLPPSNQETATNQPVSADNWSPDGVLGENEYLGEMLSGNFEIRWLKNDKTAYFGIRAKTGGWVAVGFSPSDRMKDADMVLGFVNDGQTTVTDQFSTGTFGPHNTDVELGGTDDILESGGREDGGFTTIEFSRPLNTGDQYDKELFPGKTEIIWAYGTTDNIDRQHITRGQGEIDL